MHSKLNKLTSPLSFKHARHWPGTDTFADPTSLDPPLTTKLAPSGTLETWMQEGELRERWDSFLAASNTMLRRRRQGMLELDVGDAEPSSGKGGGELAGLDHIWAIYGPV